MQNSAFLYFLTLMLFRQKSKHIGAIMISVIIIFLLSAVLFISSSLQYSLLATLEGQADFSVSRVQAGRPVNTPVEWVERILEINGVSHVAPRIYGRYFFTPREKSFLVVGIDFFDEQNSKAMEKLIEEIDLKRFLSAESMLVGEGVKRFLEAHYFKNDFTFKTPKGTFKKVKIYKVLPEQTNLIANDMIVMPLELAREVFGMRDDEVTDITFNVPNDAEWDNIITKLHLMFYDVRVVEKREIKKAYENLYNYKGGLFLILYLVSIVTFMLVLYQRYSMVYSTERKEIGILRATGWSIKDILRLKFYENLIIVIVSFTVGVVLAYLYVFIFDAPLLSQIFLGGANLPNRVSFIPALEFGILGSVFLFYAVPFLAAVLIPAWKIAVTSPREAMQ
ncbi:ABC transporter permease [Sulfurovum sp. ST-21]|uniref:ABC transporter permease n=1 Tax=Sulfurovum indicum TaxID=2779528 RepID=A0A7M1S749_9BACT|nr:FtsX-like permease family protein [Sulfurovum indicum]QOR62180.1 ABC transporter permease [Sulfurovum indicum]